MRILVLSDIHANWEALRAVIASERADRVLCLGDTVEYGPAPAETVGWVREHADLSVQGNHDAAAALGLSCRSPPAFLRLAEGTRPWTLSHLSGEHRRYLAQLPTRIEMEIDGVNAALLHAGPEDPLYQYLPPSDLAGWRRAVANVKASLILVGHTHMPMVLEVGEKRVVNPGSVGLPRDGDPRACYAVLENGRPVLRRVRYDTWAAVRSLCAMGLRRDIEEVLATAYERGELPA
jgi:putative phosphoesterase